MLLIEPLTEQHTNGVELIVLAPHQVKYCGTVSEFLSDKCPTTHRFVITYQEAVVGFFKLDTRYQKHYDFCPPNALGLRAVAIDHRHQNQGLGQQMLAVLFDYLQQNYHQFDRLFLTVNCNNPQAKACYLNSGFVDFGAKYYGGAAGAQDIMCKVLVSSHP